MRWVVILVCTLFLAAGAPASQHAKTKKGKPTTAASALPKGTVVIQTSMGDIAIQLFDDLAPKHAANFRKLANENFYVGTTFHRVIPGFMIQGGDPNSKDDDRSNDGLGGPGYTIDAEIHASNVRGVIAAARQGDAVNPQRKSNGSQFYITVADAKYLDGQYTVFGKVIKGMEIADKISLVPRDSNDNPLKKVVIQKVSIVK